MFLMFIVLLTIPGCLICTRPLRRWKWFHKKHSATATSMKGNLWIRFIIEGCLDISICASLNYIYIQTSHLGLQWDTTFQIVNSAALIILAAAVFIFPFWMLYFYCKNFSKWEDEHFEEKYGQAFEGLKKTQRSSIVYPVVFILRRFALVVIVTLGRDHLFIQIITMVTFSAIQVYYLTSY